MYNTSKETSRKDAKEKHLKLLRLLRACLPRACLLHGRQAFREIKMYTYINATMHTCYTLQC